MMLNTMRRPSTFKKVNLLLMKGADRLTGEDLVQITQVAEQAGAAIYISIPSWQVLMGVPGVQHQQVLETLRKRGYDSVKVTRKLDGGSTLQLSGRSKENEVPSQNRRVKYG
jgi:hypothetical protein